MSIQCYTLSAEELAQIHALINDIEPRYRVAESLDFIENAQLYAHQLPLGLRQFLLTFKQAEAHPACVIKGYHIDDNKIGLTPEHWEGHPDAQKTKQEQLFFILCSALLGELFAWLTQQNGYFIHDIFPVAGYEKQQIGSSSDVLLKWHTEDAFHPARGDYLGLMCMRNPCHGVTTVGSVEALKSLTEQEKQLLSEKHFIIRPDNAHHACNNYQSEEQDDANNISDAYSKIQSLTIENKMALLYGNMSEPYLCIDPAYMLAIDAEADKALTRLIHAIDEKLLEVILKAGDICFVDNFRAVHGRNPFTPRYDGYDRWLKRTNITRDLRKSRAFRSDPSSRIIDIIAD